MNLVDCRNYSDFISLCDQLPAEDVDFVIGLDCAVSNLHGTYLDQNLARKNLKEIYKNDFQRFGSIADGISRCVSYCNKRLSNANAIGNSNFYKEFFDNLTIVSNIIMEIVNEKPIESRLDADNIDIILDSYDKKIQEVNEELKNVGEQLSKQRDVVDSKISSILTNNISILGVFVAIAFAGFGSLSIWTGVDISVNGNLIANTFFLILVSLLIYNLLLFLFYFVYKLSLITQTSMLFRIGINLRPFFVVDGILAFIVIALFVVLLLQSSGILPHIIIT